MKPYGSVLFLVAALLSAACRPIIKSLGPFHSHSVQESKEIGGFCWEYAFDPPFVESGDSIRIPIREAFAEYAHCHAGFENPAWRVTGSSPEIVIVLDGRLPDSYGVSWEIGRIDGGNDRMLVLRCGDRPEADTLADTLSLCVVRCDGTPIGRLSLRRIR